MIIILVVILLHCWLNTFYAKDQGCKSQVDEEYYTDIDARNNFIATRYIVTQKNSPFTSTILDGSGTTN